MGLRVSGELVLHVPRAQSPELTTAWRGSSRSSSPDLGLSWPFFPFGGILCRLAFGVLKMCVLALWVVEWSHAARGGGDGPKSFTKKSAESPAMRPAKPQHRKPARVTDRLAACGGLCGKAAAGALETRGVLVRSSLRGPDVPDSRRPPRALTPWECLLQRQC